MSLFLKTEISLLNDSVIDEISKHKNVVVGDTFAFSIAELTHFT